MAGLSPNSSPVITPAASPIRAPPSTLFLGPPSANTSNLSLPSTSTKPVRAPLLRSRSTRAPEPAKKSNASNNVNASAGGSGALGRSARGSGGGPLAPQQPAETDRTDALWAEMQATLAEVEISALSGTHVFGEAHSRALEQLREAQIALAVAWGRGEADEEDDDQTEAKLPGRDASKTSAAAGDANPYGVDDDEADIREARRRREANERFFKRVGEGVVDVVGKLEGVAQAMAKVEKESREIWRDGESVDSGSGIS